MADVFLFRRESSTEVDTTDSETLNVINLAHFILEHRISRVAARIATAGGTVIAFDQFAVQAQFVKNGTWHTIQSTFGAAGDINNVVLLSDDLENLVHGSSGIVIVNTKAFWAIRYQSAQAAATALVVTRTLEVGAGFL